MFEIFRRVSSFLSLTRTLNSLLFLILYTNESLLSFFSEGKPAVLLVLDTVQHNTPLFICKPVAEQVKFFTFTEPNHGREQSLFRTVK